MNPDDSLQTKPKTEALDLRGYPRYVQVAWDLTLYLLELKDAVPMEDRTGKFAIIPLDIKAACVRFKCTRRTLQLALGILREIGVGITMNETFAPQTHQR